MKSYDFEAVVIEGAVYCVECVGEGTDLEGDDVTPIFADSEHDSYPVCDGCFHVHDYVSLTEEGEKQAAAHRVFLLDGTTTRDFGAFEAAQGLHWHCTHNADGQWGTLYRVQCELDYTPGRLEGDSDGEANDWYKRLDAGEVDAEDLLAAIQVSSERQR